MGQRKSIWLPYRFNEVKAHTSGEKWILLVEGENCVETGRSKLGLLCTTFPGDYWSFKYIKFALKKFIAIGVAGIAFFRDNDDLGIEKAQRIDAVAAKLGLPFLVIEPTELWEDMPHTGDIVDWVKWGQTQGMHREQFVEQLERVIATAADQRLLERAIQESNEQENLGLTDWSQPGIAYWLLKKKNRLHLTWNSQIKEWFRYSEGMVSVLRREPARIRNGFGQSRSR